MKKIIYLFLWLSTLSFPVIFKCQSSSDGLYACPVSVDFLLHPPSNNQYNLIASSTPQSSFTSSAIVTCGNFRVYYEDLQQQSGDGFADPVYGAFW